MELVTPLLAMRRMLQLAGLRSSDAYAVVRWLLLCTFTPLRLGLCVVLIGRVAFHWYDFMDMNPIVIGVAFGICGSALLVLNVYSAVVLSLSSCGGLVSLVRWSCCRCCVK
jgi:hypothetical protein